MSVIGGGTYCNRCGLIAREEHHPLGGCRCLNPDLTPRDENTVAIFTLRKFMCCAAGREQVERELIRPFGYIAAPDTQDSDRGLANEDKKPERQSERWEIISWADVQVGDTLSLYTQVSGSEYEYLPVTIIVATEEEIGWRYGDGAERTIPRARCSGDSVRRISRGAPEQSHTDAEGKKP
jgi:hypothetical protein